MICQSLLQEEPTVHENCRLNQVKLGIWTEIGPNNIWENVEFGDFSYTAGNNHLQNARIGNFANIAWGVRIGPTNHPMGRPTQHHFTYRRKLYGFADQDDQEFFAWRQAQLVEVGHDVWLGHNAIILPKVAIGNGAVVGSGAVVTKDVDPYTVVAGVPAKIIGRRFPADLSQRMEKIQWWYWPYELIKERFQDFLLEPEAFVNKYHRD